MVSCCPPPIQTRAVLTRDSTRATRARVYRAQALTGPSTFANGSGTRTRTPTAHNENAADKRPVANLQQFGGRRYVARVTSSLRVSAEVCDPQLEPPKTIHVKGQQSHTLYPLQHTAGWENAIKALNT